MTAKITIPTEVKAALESDFSAEVSKHFNVPEAEFTKFLHKYISKNFSKEKARRAERRKGPNGKGRISGYILFSTENRSKVLAKNPDIQFTDVGKKLGNMWKSLSDAERKAWNSRAAKENLENGFTPKEAETPAPQSDNVSLKITKTRKGGRPKATPAAVESTPLPPTESTPEPEASAEATEAPARRKPAAKSDDAAPKGRRRNTIEAEPTPAGRRRLTKAAATAETPAEEKKPRKRVPK